ncbi:two-component system sensor histidine kinase CreC [Rubritalea sp.]|uniref:two-component system sensor histidine kinase CreC n=1 Tax=Rubritalea sp. TaxID=2109375 RepID=UPI003EF96E08
MKIDLFAPVRITRSVTALVATVSLFGFYSLYKNLTDELENQTFQATEEVLVETVHLFAAHLETHLGEFDTLNHEALEKSFSKAKEHQFIADIHGFQKTKVGLNFYLTDTAGQILFDSGRPQRIGADYSQHNDVFLALKDTYAVRSSREKENDSKSSILYVAAPIKNANNNIIGAISVYKAQNDVLPFIAKRHRNILLSLAFIGSGIALFIIAVFIWLFRPLGKLTEYARAINRGERPRYPSLGKSREANTLGRALRDMRASLDGRRYMEHYTQMLTHELKSPLAAIQGAAELLEEDMPAEQRNKFLNNIRKETKRSTEIIDGLLQLSRLEAEQELHQLHPVELAPLFSELQTHMRSRLEAKQITLEIDCPPTLRVNGDEMMLETAIANLLENAIEFSPQNSEIALSAEALENRVKITVLDQGPGLADFVKDRAFEHFFSLREEGKGSGLGLVFVKEVAQLHSGEVTLENHPSGGAIATITLPQSA